MRSNDTHEGTLRQIADGPDWTGGQQLRIAFENLTTTLTASVLCAFVIVLLLWPAVDNQGLILWLGVVSVLTLMRLTLQQRYERSRKGADNFTRWNRSFVGSTMLSGIVWGCLSAFLFPAESVLHQVYLGFVLAGICAGAVSAYSAVPGAFPSFVVPALLPFAFQMAIINELQGKVTALLIAAFALSLVRSARESRRNYQDLLDLQVKNASLTRELHHRATHDALVNLVNQGEFSRRLERLTSTNRREDGDYSLIFIDLDLFKEVNDTGGHAAGDLILKGVADILGRRMRSGDTAARVGGDEFAAILEGCPQERALEIAETIRTDIENMQIEYDRRFFSVKASIGVSYGRMGEHTATSMLKAADAACYAAKESGRNRVQQNPASEAFKTTDRFELTQSMNTSRTG